MIKNLNSSVFRSISVLILALMLFNLAFSTHSLKAAGNPKYPILLIHGLASDPSSWKRFPEFLEHRGYDVFVMDFKEWDWLPYANKTNKTFKDLSAVIARQIAEIRKYTGKDKVDIVAHSIAGIAVRGYIAGWGGKIEKRGKYSNDIDKVIYLCTPHFGLEMEGNKLRQLMKSTDYGKFMDPSNLIKALEYSSPDLIELNDFFIENGDKLGIEELTVYSEADHVVKNFSANLDGLKSNPFIIPRPNAKGATLDDSHHVNLKPYAHAYHDLLGRPNRTILGVGSTSHAVLKITDSFFRGDTSWKRQNLKIKGGDASMVIMRVAPGNGINLRDFKPYGLTLKKVRSPKKKIGVKMVWNNLSKVHYFTGVKSGTFELSYPPAGNYSFRFDLSIKEGAVSIATFDPSNPPFDPDLEIKPGDDTIKPGQIPAGVNDYESLRRFVLAVFPFEARIYKTGKAMKSLVKEVRDALAATYANLNKNKKIDQLVLGPYTSVDFAEGSDNEGILANKLTWTVVNKEPKQPPLPEDTTFPDSPPSDVNDYNSLKQFVLWYLRENAYRNYYTRKVPAGMVRDKLAQMYSNIERINDQQKRYGYSANDDRHRDAFYLVREVLIIDFVVDSTGAGSLLPNNLTWSPTKLAPWDMLP